MPTVDFNEPDRIWIEVSSDLTVSAHLMSVVNLSMNPHVDVDKSSLRCLPTLNSTSDLGLTTKEPSSYLENNYWNPNQAILVRRSG